MKKWKVSWLEGTRIKNSYHRTLKQAVTQLVKKPAYRLSLLTQGNYVRVGGCDPLMGFAKGRLHNKLLGGEGFETVEELYKFRRDISPLKGNGGPDGP